LPAATGRHNQVEQLTAGRSLSVPGSSCVVQSSGESVDGCRSANLRPGQHRRLHQYGGLPALLPDPLPGSLSVSQKTPQHGRLSAQAAFFLCGERGVRNEECSLCVSEVNSSTPKLPNSQTEYA